jgi:hypothetical protein
MEFPWMQGGGVVVTDERATPIGSLVVVGIGYLVVVDAGKVDAGKVLDTCSASVVVRLWWWY